MVTTLHPRRGSFSSRLLGSLAAIAALLVVMFLLLGRPQQNTKVEQSGTEEEVVGRRAEDELLRVLDGVKPLRLDITSDRVTQTRELNSWRGSYGRSAEEVAKLTSDSDLIKKLLPAEVQSRINSQRFLPEDIVSLREAFLARQIVEMISSQTKTDLERVVAVFDYVTMNAAYVSDESATALPLTPYETLVFGLGTGSDRAWTFASIIRQLGMDAVRLVPQTAGKEEAWLVAVLDPRNGILLFDPRIGLPIPSAKADQTSPYPNVPATLQEVLQSDASFRLLDLPDSPYPLTSDDLKHLKVELIGTSSEWAPRMAELQSLLPESVPMEVYCGLGENKLRANGLYQRVVAAGRDGLWTEEQVSVWPFPEQQVIHAEVPVGGAVRKQLDELRYIFDGPYNVLRVDPVTKQEYVGRPDHTLQYVRLEQLQGNYNIALREYLHIRRSATSGSTQANHIAADYATLWTGVTQYQTHRYSAALNTFRSFDERNRGSETLPWERLQFEWAARSLVAENKLAEGAEMLTQAPPGLMQRRDVYLAERWKRLAAPKSEPTEPSKPAATSPSSAADAAKGSTEQPAAPAPTSPSAESTPPATPAPETPAATPAGEGKTE
ncbi:hypothetical protein [Planctomicrobium sp. SH664]|uniref:hypothetical protein n=1 Tax=Planctomicrobium sp. SH664 TaxID=3448125 RepID=UPI003F5B6EA3